MSQTVTVEVADDGDTEPEADVVVELTHAVSGADYGANGVVAEPVEVLVPGFEVDIDGVLQVQVPEDGVVTVSVTVPENTLVPAGLEVRLMLPQDRPESEVLVQVIEELPEQQLQGFRVDDDDSVVVDIKLVDENGMSLSLGMGESAVVCLPSESSEHEVLYRYDDDVVPPAWVALPPPPGGSSDDKLVCGVTEHFSLFALIVQLVEPELEFSVKALTVGIGEEEAYTVVLVPVPEGSVTVTVTVKPGEEARAGELTVSPLSLTFTPGNGGTQTVTVSAAEEAERDKAVLIHTASGGRYSADWVTELTVRVGQDTELLQRAWLARFGRTVAAQVTGAVSERLAAGSSSGSQWTLGRLASWDGRKILSGSSFRYSLSEGSEPGWTMWGRGAYTDFEGEEPGTELDGEVVTGTVGVDFERGRWLAGLAVSHSEGDGEARGELLEGKMDLSLTGAHPYLRVDVTESLSLWGTVGYGEGELERESGGERSEVDLEMRQGAAGLRGRLTSWGSVDLALKSEVLVAKLEAEGEAALPEIEADASQARLMLEGVGYCELASGGRLEPSGEIGARYDGGDAEEGVGMEVGAGLRYASAHGRLTADGSVRGLLTHEESDYDEWGVSGALRLAPERSGRGLSLQLDSSYGAMASRAAEWWRQDGAGLGEAGAVSGARFEAELAYGLNAANGRGVLVPYAGFSAAGRGERLALGFEACGGRVAEPASSKGPCGSERTRETSTRWSCGCRDAGRCQYGVKTTRLCQSRNGRF